jgi:hypothetical protein
LPSQVWPCSTTTGKRDWIFVLNGEDLQSFVPPNTKESFAKIRGFVKQTSGKCFIAMGENNYIFQAIFIT